MKTLILVFGFLVLLAGVAGAASLEWDRNVESDMANYRVYACFTKGCVVTQSGPMLQPGTVAQPAVGAIPKWPIPANKEGSLAVSAVDTSANESPLSAPVGFDTLVPSAPINLRIIP